MLRRFMERKHDSAINDNYDERLASDMTVQEMLVSAKSLIDKIGNIEERKLFYIFFLISSK